MALTNAGRDFLAAAAIESVTLFNNANGRLGVGDSTTAFDAAHTDLQAATNKLRKAMDSTYPQRTGNVVTVRATFATGDANWAWEELAWFNAAAAGTMMARKVENKGTKTSAESWELTGTYTFAAA